MSLVVQEGSDDCERDEKEMRHHRSDNIAEGERHALREKMRQRREKFLLNYDKRRGAKKYVADMRSRREETGINDVARVEEAVAAMEGDLSRTKHAAKENEEPGYVDWANDRVSKLKQKLAWLKGAHKHG